MGGIITWLFTDPATAGGGTGLGPGGDELFHFYVPWIIFCALGLMVPFYYWVEGRKRFFKKNILNKRLMDKYMNKWVVIALVGWPLIGARWLLDTTPLSWRFWRYLWLIWLVENVVRLLYYLIVKYPDQRQEYLRNARLLEYFPKPRESKKPREAKAGRR
jgi:hypothetical protein